MNKIDNSDRFDDFDGLTLFETLEELIGAEMAARLCCENGGRVVYIPHAAPDDHWLVLAIGRAAADKVCNHFRNGHRSGSRLLLPMGRYGRAEMLTATVSDMTDKGLTAPQIAISLRVHVRTVYRIRRKIRAKRCKLFGVPIQRMLKQGLSAEEIAVKLHIPLAGIRSVIAEVERRNAPVSSAVAR